MEVLPLMLTKHPPIRAVIVTAVAALSLFFAPAALAGKGGGGGGKPHGGGGTTGSGTVSPVYLDSTDGVAHWGQRVTFRVSTTSTSQPWVTLKCYQGGTLVAQSSEGFFSGSLDDGVFGLYSGMWTGGAADCTGTLSGPDWAPIATTSFHVYA
jgi:hypothetical protein